MKKITTILLIIVMLTIVAVMFIGCGDKDFSDFQKQLDELNNRVNELDIRVKKLEATISLLDTVGESEQFTELKNKVIALQKDLVDNSANDMQIKTQVTQMQLTLDKIAGGGNVDDTVLLEIQNKLNTLYGEVNRVLPFENGKEYEVKLNGVVYYTVSVLIEYHDGIVQSQQDIKVCDPTHGTTFLREHFCGSILIHNKSDRQITLNQIKMGVICFIDNEFYCRLLFRNKEGTMDDELIKSLEPGKNGRFYYYLSDVDSANQNVKENFKLTFRMPELNAMTLLTLDNVWGDENGLKPPIVGTKN